MRTPHIATHQLTQSDGRFTEPVPSARDPYEELASLGDPSLDDALTPDSTPPLRTDDADEPWAPPNHRRGSRRRNRATGLPTLAKAVAWLLTLSCLLVLADRWALLYAERKASERLKDQLHLTAAPEVRIGGFPFLTQLAARRLESVSITVPSVPAHRVTLTQITATGHRIRIDGDGPTAVRGALVPQLHGRVLLSFADMDRELGASQVDFTAMGPDRIRASGSLRIAGDDLRVRADARVRRDGDRGIATAVDGIRLDIGDLATYRPGTGPTEGLHLSPGSVRRLTQERDRVRALLGVPEIVRRLGVPDSAVRLALRDESELHRLTGAPRFLHGLTRVNLLDTALAHPEVLTSLGLDPSLLAALTKLTRPQLADRFTFSFQLPKPPAGVLRLQRVAVGKDGVHADIGGSGLLLGH
ncbi:DUF2993 domain-containing protein [Streptomyces sp. NPDC052301]|uniref:DUF2993 domain-containing protein n=1 Tax=Streptomyces sp. NPDC052301 TaxID=3365687 RepID=UPI0037D1EDBE